MVPHWLNVLSWIFILSGGVTALGVAASLFCHPQRMAVMNVVWPITALYFGPFGG